MRKCYKWLVPAFLFVSLACAVFGLVTNAKYVHEKQGATVTLTINYQQNYLAPKSSLPDFSATNATKLVFTTLDRLSTYNIAYDELTNQADAGYDDVTATTTSAIRYGYDATEKTGYFISMTNRPIVPYSCAKLFSGNAKLKTIDFGDTVTVGTDEEGNEIKVPLFDTSSATDMGGMFSSCTSLASLNVSNFDTSNVTNMENMFYDCRSLTSLDLSNFKVRNAYNTQKMFLSCSNLQTIFVSSDWSLSGATTNMFQGCTALVGGEGTTYDENHVDKAYAVIDNGTERPGYFTGISLNSDAFHTLADSIKHITFGKASNHADVVKNTNAVVTPLGSAGSSSSYAVSGYTVTENGEATLYVLSEYAPIVAPADCTSLIGNSLDGRVVTFEREDLSDATSCAWFDTSKVTNMTKMFSDGTSGNQNSITINGLDTFDTSKVTDMQYMFCGDGNLQPIDLSAFDTSNVTDMKFMFYNCSNLTSIGDISGWDVSGVTDMQRMFSGCSALPAVSLSQWNVFKVENMDHMFYGCSKLTSLDFSAWDVSSVTVMSNMFYNCSSLTEVSLSQWDVSKVQKMNRMFAGCSALTSLDLSAWDTSSVADISNMFWTCSDLTSLNVSSWNTSNVKNMSKLFYDCKALTELNLLGWSTSGVNNMQYMFNGCSSLTTIYVGDGWTANVSDNNSSGMFRECSNLVGGAGTKYSSSNIGKTYAVIDGQNGQKGYLTFAGTLNTVDVHSLLAEHTEINSVVFGSATAHDVTGAEATPVSFAGNAVNCYLVGSTAYFLSAQPIVVWYDASNLFKELTGIQTITFESVNGTAWFDTSRVTNMKGMFEAQQNGDSFTSSITAINGLDTFNTSKVTDMTNMFRHCESLAGALDLSSWDTSNVTDMQHMFDGLCSVSSITFGQKFSTSKVTDMNHMFNACGTLTSLDLSMFDTSNVKSMFAMFNMCVELQSITFGTNFKTAEVTSMGYMFAGDLKLAQLDLLTFETANVTDMKHMFHDCSTVTVLDLSAFNTVKVTDMTSMFNSCSALRTIYVGDGWTTANAVTTDMFYNCTAVVGGSGTTYSADHTDGGYARVDGAMKNDGEDAVLLSDFEYCGTPGYLTAKNAMPSGSVLNALLKANLPATVTNLVIGSIGGGTT